MPVSVKVLQNRLPGASLRLRQRAGQLSQQSAYRIRDDAKARVHVITGALRDSIEAVKQGAFTWTVNAGSETVDYAGYEEYGTSRRPPHPYLTPAAEVERPRFEQAMDDLLDRGVFL